MNFSISSVERGAWALICPDLSMNADSGFPTAESFARNRPT